VWLRCRYKAAGDSKLLQALGESHSIKVDIVNLVEAGRGGVEGQVSSSKIRHALNCGHMEQVAESLGRPYRLVAEVLPKDMCLVPNGLQDNGLRSGHEAKHKHLKS
jgi:FAD synthase